MKGISSATTLQSTNVEAWWRKLVKNKRRGLWTHCLIVKEISSHCLSPCPLPHESTMMAYCHSDFWTLSTFGYSMMWGPCPTSSSPFLQFTHTVQQIFLPCFQNDRSQAGTHDSRTTGLRANWYDYSRNIIFPKSPFFSSLLYCLPFHSPWLLLALHKTFLSLVSFCLCFPVRKYCGIWNKQANKQQTVCVLRTVPAFQSVLSICIINHIQLWFSAKVRMFSRGKWYCLQMFGVCVCVCVLAYSCVHVISSYWHHTVNKSHADPKSQ